MKKKIAIFFMMLLIANTMVVPAYGIEPENLQSRAAILINGDDGQILFEKNADDKMPPASITKIMLLLLISERMETGEITLDQELTISEYASGISGCHPYLKHIPK